ncbi:MAG: helix-turn-helix domain-containing protein [Sphingomonas fennica]
MGDAGHELPNAAPTVGAELRQAREARGLALEAVAERTRIPMRHLLAIERGVHDDLPALPYSAGFVKAYAQQVGLDGADLSRRFRIEAGEVDRSASRYEPYEPADPRRVPSRLIAVLGAVAAVALVLGYLLWRGGPGQEELTRTAAADPVAVAPVAPLAAPAVIPAAAPAAPAADAPVVLAADRDVWVKVSEAGGPNLFMGVIKAGSRYEVPPAATAPRLQTGRPEGLTVTVGDTRIAALAPPSTVIRDVGLKPADLLARPGPATGAAAAGPPAAASETPPAAAGEGIVLPGAASSG